MNLIGYRARPAADPDESVSVGRRISSGLEKAAAEALTWLLAPAGISAGVNEQGRSTMLNWWRRNQERRSRVEAIATALMAEHGDAAF
jgi:hypothetical protein